MLSPPMALNKHKNGKKQKTKTTTRIQQAPSITKAIRSKSKNMRSESPVLMLTPLELGSKELKIVSDMCKTRGKMRTIKIPSIETTSPKKKKEDGNKMKTMRPNIKNALNDNKKNTRTINQVVATATNKAQTDTITQANNAVRQLKRKGTHMPDTSIVSKSLKKLQPQSNKVSQLTTIGKKKLPGDSKTQEATIIKYEPPMTRARARTIMLTKAK